MLFAGEGGLQVNRGSWQLPRWLVYLVYNCLYPVLLLCLLPGQIGKMRRRGGYAVHSGQRFGRFDEDFLAFVKEHAPVGQLWIHAVSVGEMNQALRFADTLREQGGWKGGIVLSTTTSTGRRLAEKRCDPATRVVWMPFDFPWVMRRMLRVLAPRCVVLIEAEVWPNLLAAADRAVVPVYLANARLSPRSKRRFRKFRPIVAPVFSSLAGVGIADENDRHHWLAMGVADQKIHTTGAIKYDLPATTDSPAQSEVEAAWKRLEGWGTGPVVLAASTHAGEERLIASAARKLQATLPQLKLIVIPRHFERAPEVADALRQSGWQVVRRSTLNPDASAKGDALLVDTTGELNAWLAYANLVVVGKSLAGQTGGQNPAEPVQAGIPTIVGPRMDNFTGLVEALLAVDGIRRINADSELQTNLQALLENPEKGKAMARRGCDVLNRHRGACVNTLKMISTNHPF